MKKMITRATLLTSCLLAGLLQSASAHHSFAMFDNSKEQLVIGRVVRWAFNNPHTWLYIEATDANGETQTWGFEGGAQIRTMRYGVNGNTYQPGELVKVVMHPLRSGQPAGAMCVVQKEDGSITLPFDGVCDAEGMATRWQEAGRFESGEHLQVFAAGE